VGIDADVASRFKHSKMRGPLPYIYQAFITFFTYKPDSYTLEIDNQVLFLPQAHLISFSNGTQWGYDAHVTPEARLSDGWLNVVILRHLSIWNFPKLVMALVLGENYRPKDIERYVCKTGKITRSKAGDAQVDGEHILESQTIEVKIQEKSLRLLLPNTLTQDKIDTL
jgi:diacylglycerol kinase family enzyme